MAEEKSGVLREARRSRNKKLLAVADAIEGAEHYPMGNRPGFAMGEFFASCNSPRCVGGYLVHMYGKHRIGRFIRQVAEILEISTTESGSICYPYHDDVYRMSPRMVAANIRNWTETGVVGVYLSAEELEQHE